MNPLQYQMEQYRRFYQRENRNAGAMWLGGTSGSDGGSGGPPGGFYGQLPQSYVCFDTSELELTSGSDSLVDNLNHIRKRIADLEATSGSSGSGFYNTIQDDGVDEEQRDKLNFIDGVGIDIAVTDDAGNSRTNVTPSLDINGLTEDTDPDENADYIATYDASATAIRKVLLSNLPSSGSGGSSTFTGLTDTPSSYSGQSLKFVRVNEGETALEFTATSGSGADDFVDLNDTPSAYTGYGGYVVAVKDAEDGLEFIEAGGVGSSGSTVEDACVWVEIGSIELTSGSASIGFSSIPSGYDELRLTGKIRSATAVVTEHLYIALNDDTTATNYRYNIHDVYGTTSHTPSSGNDRVIGIITAASEPSGYFSFIDIGIQGYARSEDHMLYGVSYNRYGSTYQYMRHAVLNWESTNAITSVSLSAAGAGDLVSGSRVTLYGLLKTDLGTSGSGGASTFLDLTDSPSSYSGQSLKFVRVNEGETALEFTSTSGSGADDFLDLNDTPSSYSGQSLKAVRVNSGETALEFYTPSSGSGGGHTILDEDGDEMTQRDYLQFTGPNVSVTDSSGSKTLVTIGEYPAFSGVRAYHNTTQEIPNNSWTQVVMNSEEYDTDSYHSTVSDTARCVVPTSGYYHVTGSVAFDTDIEADDWIQIGIMKNDYTHYADQRLRPVTSGSTCFQISSDFYLAANDNVRLKIFQSTGGDITLLGGEHRTWIAVHYIAGGSGTLFQGARVYLSGNQSINTSTWTSVTFGTESYDIGDIWTSGSNTRLTAPATGYYHITGNLRWESNSTGRRGARIRKNGTDIIAEVMLPNTGENECTFHISTDYPLDAGDYVELMAYHEKGTNLSLFTAEYGTFFSMHLTGQ